MTSSLWSLFWITLIFAQSAFGIRCFIGNASMVTPNDVIDCSSLGMQREELYCRNISMPDETVYRSCVAMSWFDASWEELGCQTNHGITRCTCEHDLCNGPTGVSAVATIKGRNISVTILIVITLSYITNFFEGITMVKKNE